MRGPLNPLRFNDLLSRRPTTHGSSATSLALKAKPFKPRLNEQVLPFDLRSEHPKYPSKLTRKETDAVMAHLTQENRLLASLLYGSGLR